MKRTLRLIALGAAVLTAGPALAGGKAAKGANGKAATSKLVLKVAPEDTEIYVDGQKKGTAEKVKELMLTPGAHILNFKHKGDEHEDQVVLKKDTTTSFEWKFEDDRPKATDDGELREPGQ